MADAWSLIVDIPDKQLVPVRRKGSSGFEQMAIGIPAAHNVHDRSRRHVVKKIQQAALDAAWLRARWPHIRLQGPREPYDVMLVRRAPRPLDCAVTLGDCGRGIGGDNLGSSLKAARDWTAKRVFGLDDDSSQLLRWHVGQERSGKPRLYQIKILIVPAAPGWYELPDRWLRGEL